MTEYQNDKLLQKWHKMREMTKMTKVTKITKAINQEQEQLIDF